MSCSGLAASSGLAPHRLLLSQQDLIWACVSVMPSWSVCWLLCQSYSLVHQSLKAATQLAESKWSKLTLQERCIVWRGTRWSRHQVCRDKMWGRVFFNIYFCFRSILLEFIWIWFTQTYISLCSLLQAEGRMKRSCKFTEILQVRTVIANCRTANVIRLCHVKTFLNIT